jgi:hypothetical protein
MKLTCLYLTCTKLNHDPSFRQIPNHAAYSLFALKARQGERFEITANKFFKFHDVIARLHVYCGDGATERTKNVHCAQIEDYDHFVHTMR